MPEPAPLSPTALPQHNLTAAPSTPAIDLPKVVTHHARLVRDVLFAQSVGDPPSPEQKAAVRASRALLNTLRPDSARDLETVLVGDRAMLADAADGRTTAAIRAMQFEAELRADPQLRADTFVQRWQALERQRRLLLRNYEDNKAGKVADRMVGMAKGLERDPQVESILRNRKAQLGLPDAPGRSVGHSLADLVGRGRSRGIGIGM